MDPHDDLLIEEMPVHSVFRVRRRALGLTQAQLAEEVGTAQSVIAAVETGREPLSSSMEGTMREALRAHPADLLQRHRQRIIDEARTFGFESVQLFGSLARGEATEGSDVDLLVAFPAEAEHDAFAVLGLRRRLENILSLPVDLHSVPRNPEYYGGLCRELSAAVEL